MKCKRGAKALLTIGTILDQRFFFGFDELGSFDPHQGQKWI